MQFTNNFQVLAEKSETLKDYFKANLTCGTSM